MTVGAITATRAGGVEGRIGLATFYLVVIPLLVAVASAGVVRGSTPMEWGTVLQVLALKLVPAGWLPATAVSDVDQSILWLIRLPRVLVGALVGAGLATAGVIVQGLFRNPLAEPSLTGVGPGAVLGAVIVFVTGLASVSIVAIPLAAITCALMALWLVYGIATRGGATPITTLLLAGMAVGALLTAVSSFLLSINIVKWEVAEQMIFWMMGGLDGRTWAHVWLCAPFVAIGLVAAVLQARTLDLLLLGHDSAAALGVDVEPAKRLLVVTSALLTGACVGVAGLIGFVGLIVPHGVRLVLGPAHRRVIPASALAGAAFLVSCDLLARVIRPPAEVRLGIVTAICGAPFFLMLLIGRFKEGQE